MKSVGKIAFALFVAATCIASASAKAYANTCTINFTAAWWANVYNFAKDTFADPTAFDSRTHTDIMCPTNTLPNTDTGTCWDYRQSCIKGAVFTVFPQTYGHFHASFLDPTINCIDFNTFGFGRMIGTTCVPAQWWNEQRFLQAHFHDEWVEIAHKDLTTFNYLQFSVSTISVGDQPVQLWYEKMDGSVWGWSSLGPNTNWTINTGPIKAIWISGASNLPYTFYNFVASTQ